MTYQTSDSARTRTEWLDLYTDAGMTLIPCRGFSKKPAHAGFLDVPFDPEFEASTDCNYQVLLHNKFLVIDVDKRHFQPDDKPLSRLLATLELDKRVLQNTFVVTTPSGGYHVYFRKPEEIRFKSSLKDFPGLEFKTGWITAAGSYNPDYQRHYTIKKHSPCSIAKCPDMLAAMLAAPDETYEMSEFLKDNPTNVQRFIDYLLATEPAVEGAGGDKKTFQVACIGKDMGLGWQKIYELMCEHFNPRCRPSWDEEELEAKVKNAFSYGLKPGGVLSVEAQREAFDAKPAVKKIFWQRNKDKSLKRTLHNTVQFLSGFSDSVLKDKLRYNLFSHRIEFCDQPPWRSGPYWSDDDAIMVKNYLSTTKMFEVGTQLIHEAATVIASQKSYHPVRDYICGLEWDRVPRLDDWLPKYCGAKSDAYTRFVGRKTLLGAVSRVFKPGCKFDHVLVLEGRQGIGKSLSLRTLAEPWFTDATFDMRSKDAIEIIQGHWIIELGEMDFLSKAESRTLKAFITRQEDRTRPAYGRLVKDFPRQCIFIGTINPEAEGYLKDPTGNRRFWPVAVEQINIAALREVRDQLWAEAYCLYQQGEALYVDNELVDRMARKEVDKRQQEDPWMPMIATWIDKHIMEYFNEEERQVEIEPADIYVNCIGGTATTLSNRESLRIATSLKTLGFRKIRLSNKRSVYTKPLDKLL